MRKRTNIIISTLRDFPICSPHPLPRRQHYTMAKHKINAGPDFHAMTQQLISDVPTLRVCSQHYSPVLSPVDDMYLINHSKWGFVDQWIQWEGSIKSANSSTHKLPMIPSVLYGTDRTGFIVVAWASFNVKGFATNPYSAELLSSKPWRSKGF